MSEEKEIKDISEEQIEKEAEMLAKMVATKLNLKELERRVKKLSRGSQFEDSAFGVASKIYDSEDVKKTVDTFTKEEKVVGFFQALIRQDSVVLRALSEGVAADGGYLFPDEFRAELIRDLADPTHMRGLVRVIPMKRDIMNIPKLGSRPHVRWTSENAAKSTTTADFTQKTLTVHKVAAIMYASEELIDDCDTFDVVKLIIGLFAEELGREEDRVITAGSGAGQPTGLTNCTITNVTCAGNLGFDDMINLIYELPVQYRPAAKFLVNNANVRELRKLKDTTNRYIWQDAVAPGQPATIFGYPIIVNNWIPESEIYFGDYKRGYWLGDRQKMTVKVSDIAGQAWDHDQIGIRVVERIAGTCVLENAIRCLNAIP